jgi:hypothetical protein
VNVEKYLQDVRVELIKFGPTLRLKITENHRKTMLRTLFGMPTKVDFDNAFRNACNSIQQKRMVQFIQDDLRPTIEQKKTTSIMSTLSNNAPNFYEEMDRALGLATLETVGGTTGRKLWSNMARGRRHRGNFGHLLHDLAPELLSKYENARLPPIDSDVFAHMLQDDSSVTGVNMDKARRKAAERCIELKLESPACASTAYADMNEKHGKKKGIECHQACVQYLRERHAFVLENVLVKSAQANRRNKAVATLKDDNGVAMNTVGTTGVITSSASKEIEKMCGEFDAMVLVERGNDGSQSQQHRVAEIWEAKATISPTTLHDVITKKIPAIQSLLADESSLLWYSHDQTIPLCDNDSSGHLLHVFGLQILPTMDAAGVIKAVTCINALSRDMEVVVQALDTGFVEVDLNAALERLDRVVDGVEDLVAVIREQDR